MIAVVSHDAGGAELVSSWIAAQDEEYYLVLDGPAKDIFELKLGKVNVMPLEESIFRSDWVLCGSSWQSKLELTAIQISKLMGKKCVSLFDHWANFSERLYLAGGQICVPDEIWVVDKYAEEIARQEFPTLRIRRIRNHYFEELKKKIESIPKQSNSFNKCRVLFVTEPIEEHAKLHPGGENVWGYDERKGLEYFVENIEKVLPYKKIDVTIRTHPSECAEKYTWICGFGGLDIKIGRKRTLLEAILSSDIVVGWESMALVVGLLANKRVISAIPPGGKRCALPHEEIEVMTELLANKSRT